jgi:hypothetical protein
MSIEDDLHRALRRKPAPPDLVDRVLARIDEPPARSGWTLAATRHAAMRWLAAAAATAVVATGAARYYAYQQTVAEAERVKRDIAIALQITNEKLALVQRRVAEATQNVGP